MATIRELATDALKCLGVLGAGAGMPPEHAGDALAQMKRMIDSFNADRLVCGTLTRTTYTWTASQSSRTVGPTGNLVGQRPQWLDMAAVIPVGATGEIPLWPLLTREEYAAIIDKTITGSYFTRLRYEPTPTNGTLTVWPVPTTAPTLVLYVPTALATVTLDTVLAYAPGYEEFFQWQLARRLSPIFRQPWTPLMERLSSEAEARVKTANLSYEPIRCDPALLGPQGSRWNIETDTSVRRG